MSSHPQGLRFSPFSSSVQNNGNIIKQNMQPQPQQQTNQNNKKLQTQFSNSLFSGSETDVTNSLENLSMEERYVLRHTARVAPQGQENLQENAPPARYPNDNRFSSNTSTDSTRYPSSNRSTSETRNPIYTQPQTQTTPGNTSNRNSLKEVNSNRSSMDVSTCSYNTLIIHNDDSMYSSMNNDYVSPPPYINKMKERPRSYGEKGMQEITEIPDDYLSQSHVLKHLAKEVKIPNRSESVTRDSGVSENTQDSKENPKWTMEENNQNNKLKSKSQPDLTRLGEIDYLDSVEAVMEENNVLKKQLSNCFNKVAKSNKLEEEVAKIYLAHEELEQSCQRREKLELTIRNRLQSEFQRAQELNRALRDQMEVLQTQLQAPSDHQILIAQLFTQNKELAAAKERQEIELAAQIATLQEQRNHIDILDTALTNTQKNMRRLEDELRKKQIYIERMVQVQQNNIQSKQNERKMRMEYENELSKDSNRSGSSTNSESKWQIQEKEGQLMRLENECAKLEQRHMDETAMRQNAAKMVMEKNSQVETDRIITEAKHEKLRYLEEVHAAQRKVGELQNHLKGLEGRLAEKDALIRALQSQKNYGSSNSYDSYNLSTESFGLNPLVYNSQASFNVSNSSFNTTANTSILDPNYGHGHGHAHGQNSSNSYGGVYVTSNPNNNYGQTTQTYNQNPMNLQSITIPSNYSVSGQNSNYNPSTNYVPNSNYSPSQTNYENQYDAARKSMDDHMKKQLDEQLNKRGLCCFPSLSGKKPMQLLSDEVSVLSTNNSDAFLQKLAHIDQRERERQEMEEASNSNKNEEIILLEKQGRSSQKIRNNGMGNLAQVSQSVGQNMTDISHIGTTPNKVPKIVTSITQNLANITQTGILPPRKDRGSSLPPSALPRPPRSLKPPRKIEYDRLSDSELKKRSQTPPKLTAQRAYELKTSSLKRGEFGKNDFASNKNYMEMKEALDFSNYNKHKDYGSMNKTESKFVGYKSPDYTSTKNYERLDDTKIGKTSSDSSCSLKRSLLPSARKLSILQPTNINTTKNSRDSLNSISSGSNNSNNSTPNHNKTDSNSSNILYHHNGQFSHARTPPKYIRLTPPTDSRTYLPKTASNQQKLQQYATQQKTSSLPGMYNPGGSNSASLPPKPVDNKNNRRGSSLTRGENRYRIQF